MVKKIQFDFNNMFSEAVGATHGVTAAELKRVSSRAKKAHQHWQKVVSKRENRLKLNLEWTRLPYQSKKSIQAINRLAKEVRSNYDNVISLGIGGSYLGLKAAQDALCLPYSNEFRDGSKRPKIYFDGNNLDPEPLSVLLKNLNPKKTFVTVISKSGETTETKAAFIVVEKWLKKALGRNYGRQLLAITDPSAGSLRKRVDEMNSVDRKSFRSISLMHGVGGRFSELNMGLFHLALIGVDISEVLAGAKAMGKRCESVSLKQNPALLYATLQTVLYEKKHKALAVMMPFSESLKSTADWYAQLLAESLGKKYARKIKVDASGAEVWTQDLKRVKHVGRSPIPCRGTNDLHSIQQDNVEGENNKTITFMRVDKFRRDIKIPQEGGIIGGKHFVEMLSLAQEATEWALVQAQRPNCTIVLPEVSPYVWGGLLFFFELAVAFEGELMGINAFDQPGVESYKNYMYYKLKKPGLSAEISESIRKNPLVKKAKHIL